MFRMFCGGGESAFAEIRDQNCCSSSFELHEVQDEDGNGTVFGGV